MVSLNQSSQKDNICRRRQPYVNKTINNKSLYDMKGLATRNAHVCEKESHASSGWKAMAKAYFFLKSVKLKG